MSNPFADLESFETMRAAALGGDDAFARFQRRQASEARRRSARLVDVQLSDRVHRMLRLAVASSRAVLLVGPPGTGKTAILEQLIDEFDQNPSRWGFQGEGVDASWVTPEEEWTFDRIVLGETVDQGDLVSEEGMLLEALRTNKWLVLDETNRADMDRVLGGVLTWLSEKRVEVGKWRAQGQSDALPVYLDWTDQPDSARREVGNPPRELTYVGGRDWRLLGTYNAVDAQRVFRMGQALGRRFKHVPVPPASVDDFQVIIRGHVSDQSLVDFLTDRVSRLYAAHLLVEDAQLGPGLFVDMPAYVESGLRFAAVDTNAASHGGELDGATGGGSEGADAAHGANAFGTSSDAEPEEGEPEAGDSGGIASADDSEGPTATPPPAGDEAEEGSVSGSATDDVPTSTGSLDLTLVEELLAEAYLISVGNIIAKYEVDLLETLSAAVQTEQALSPENWAWVMGSLVAMRA